MRCKPRDARGSLPDSAHRERYDSEISHVDDIALVITSVSAIKILEPIKLAVNISCHSFLEAGWRVNFKH